MRRRHQFQRRVMVIERRRSLVFDCGRCGMRCTSARDVRSENRKGSCQLPGEEAGVREPRIPVLPILATLMMEDS